MFPLGSAFCSIVVRARARRALSLEDDGLLHCFVHEIFVNPSLLLPVEQYPPSVFKLPVTFSPPLYFVYLWVGLFTLDLHGFDDEGIESNLNHQSSKQRADPASALGGAVTLEQMHSFSSFCSSHFSQYHCDIARDPPYT